MGPLEHIRVLDLTHARAGPSAVRLLADWGADVVKIEMPSGAGPRGQSIGGNRHGPDEQNLHRNKRSLTLDLKNPRGHALFMRLAEGADVVVENFKADVKHRLGVDYQSVKAVNPAIVYASISGFGQSGPYSSRAGVDQIVQGLSGLMSITGPPDTGPWRVGIAISDTSAGMFLGQGILLALLHRERTGEGQWVHTSLFEAMLNKLDFQAARYTMNGEVPQQQGNDHPYMIPMGAFRCKDGLVNIAASGGRLWKRFCEALDAGELLQRPEYANPRDRDERKKALNAEIEAVTAHFTTAELVRKLNDVGVPCGPINDIGQAFEDEHAQHLGMAKPAPHPELGDVNLLRSPINLSAFPQADQFEKAAPDPGADSDAILDELGYGRHEIEALRADGVI
ncbi:MAG: CaiB/BaiF CoA-transferase family protein [Gammaproteobacteria bacterium]|nr:CaiB/BaiF CoA-transferase family protein [Gammaproteobacteria bacterium]